MGLEEKRIRECEHEESCITGKIWGKCNKLSGLSGNMLQDYHESIKIFSYVYIPWGPYSISWFNLLKSFKSVFFSLSPQALLF